MKNARLQTQFKRLKRLRNASVLSLAVLSMLAGAVLSTKAYNYGYSDSRRNEWKCSREGYCNYFALHRGLKGNDLFGIDWEASSKIEFIWRVLFNIPKKWIDTR